MTIKVHVDEWQAIFDKQVSAALKVSTKTQVEASKEFLTRVEQRTPIGDPSLWKWPAHKNYKPGTLRASWTLNYSESGGGVYAIIQNDQPYAERVEFGWSTQAPQGMLRITIKEWPSIVDTIGKKNKL